MARMMSLRAYLLFGVWLAASLPAAAQTAPAPGAPAPRPPRPLENIKVLTGWTGAEVRDEMQRMSAALGVRCDHCHVSGNFANDDKRPKQTARRMITMTVALNQEFFPAHQPAAGESKFGRVTCYTCHQGAVTPKLNAGFGGPAR